jgi:phytoene dehydrogenase-like protein
MHATARYFFSFVICVLYVGECAGVRVGVFERRHLLGGAAVTEELYPGFKYSRCSYVYGLFRPQIRKDLELDSHGLKLLPRVPSSFTPTQLAVTYARDSNARAASISKQDTSLDAIGQQLDPGVSAPEPRGLAEYLVLGHGLQNEINEISKFSEHDSGRWQAYNEMLQRYADALMPLIDTHPLELDPDTLFDPLAREFGRTTLARVMERLVTALLGMRVLRTMLGALGYTGRRKLSTESTAVGGASSNSLSYVAGLETPHPGSQITEFLTAPASKILDRWFESDVLKATLATDAVIGSMTSPTSPQSAYVLLHHCMGGTWSNVQGGMGALTQALATAAQKHGVDLFTDTPVAKILTHAYSDSSNSEAWAKPSPGVGSGGSSANISDTVDTTSEVRGILLESGVEVKAKHVICNAAPQRCVTRLLDPKHVGEEALRQAKGIDSNSATAKINIALDRLPQFTCLQHRKSKRQGIEKNPPELNGTIHLERSMTQIHDAYLDSARGVISRTPVIEMTLPSVIDPTLAPPGKHVCLLFVQYAPYRLSPTSLDEIPAALRHLSDGEATWRNPAVRQLLLDRVFAAVEAFAPGFTASILHTDLLTPLDLEETFALPGGNIFHASMGLDQVWFNRPAPAVAGLGKRIKGLWFASAGVHPGGGVIGAAGANTARVLLRHMHAHR